MSSGADTPWGAGRVGGEGGLVWYDLRDRDVPRSSSLTVPGLRAWGRAARWQQHRASWSPWGRGGGGGCSGSPGAVLSAAGGRGPRPKGT